MTRTLKSGLVFLVFCLLASDTLADYSTGLPLPSIDLEGCAWRASAGARITVKSGELALLVKSLPHSEPRTIECWVPLPGYQEMTVRGKQTDSVTEQGWTFSFVRTTGERVELTHSSQNGEVSFPLPPAWERDRRVGISIGIPGDNPGYVHFVSLSLQPASPGLPAAPQPVSPEQGQQVTPAAADFLWSNPNPEIASSYDLEWQRHGGTHHTKSLPANFISTANGAWTAKWLPRGRYNWKVRALNASGLPGPWSTTMHFTVQPETAHKVPDIRPSARDPLFLVDMEASDPGPEWRRVPADVQSHLLFRIGGSLDQIQRTLNEAQREHIAIALQVNGPHNIIGGRWDRLPLARVSQWAHRYSELKAFYICEQQVQGGIENQEVKSYIEHLIALGSETGRPVFWADANWGGNIWLSVVASKGFLQFAREHRGYLYPLWKMNGGFVPYLAPAGLLGLWLKGAVAGWGAQPETWYWTEASFRTLGVQRGYKEGLRQDAPPVLFQELALLGASAGAEVYSFEPGTDIFDANSGRNLETILVPLVRMLRDSVVPDVTSVKKAVIKERVLDRQDLIFRRSYTAPLRKLFSNTLGIAYPFEMVPESGSCYWIPFVPAASPAAEISKPCPAPIPGRAAVFEAGGTDFVFNSRVNWPEEQKFSLKVAGIQTNARLGLNGWVVIQKMKSGESHLWFFARTGASLDMQFDLPVAWRKLETDTAADASSQFPNSASGGWSSPVRHIELRAEHHTWDILVARKTM
jgi:hypothetical protein